ncbi:MAG TPA: hypothetical protein VJC05_00380 [Candidatus Andersenbacteria bacterium]|nr:hypothetical protein [Candidatus Andersenbacteria bacterium]
MAVTTYITGLLAFVLVGGGWYLLAQTEENTVIDILASREPELAIPVFAQFVATQTLTLEALTSVERLIVPVHFPSEASMLQIDLTQRDRLLQRWRYQPRTTGIVEADLALEPLRLLEGEVEVHFSARGVDHEHKHEAVGVFIESADGHYPGGNYRIVDNQKVGDISLKVVEQRRKLDRLAIAWEKRPLRVIWQSGLGLLFALLFLSFPSVLRRTLPPRRRQ